MTLFLFFSHALTQSLIEDAQQNLAVTEIRHLPEDLQERWSQVPPDLTNLKAFGKPLWEWLRQEASPKDYILIQGDFGMSYATVQFAFELGLQPIYATTRRESVEVQQADGSVRKTNRFAHVQFRPYHSYL